jgi:hypothetical protein
LGVAGVIAMLSEGKKIVDKLRRAMDFVIVLETVFYIIRFLLHVTFSQRDPSVANSMKVIPIRSGTSMREQQREIAELAYECWLAMFGVRYKPPEEDLHGTTRRDGENVNVTKHDVRAVLVYRSGS